MAEAYRDITTVCPACAGPLIRNHFLGAIIFDHAQVCPISDRLVGRRVADRERVEGDPYGKHTRPLTADERLLWAVVDPDRVIPPTALVYLGVNGAPSYDLDITADQTTTPPPEPGDGGTVYLLVPGPVGPSGPRGADGAPGSPGTDGADGTDGVDGADGAPGRDGADGAPGADGSDGQDGADGAPGQAGERGPEGPASTVPGPAGERGPAGADGRDLTVTPAQTVNASSGEIRVNAGSGSSFVVVPGSANEVYVPTNGYDGQRVLITLDNRTGGVTRSVRLTNAAGNFTHGSTATMVPGSNKTVPASGLAFIELTRVAGAWFPTLWAVAQ